MSAALASCRTQLPGVDIRAAIPHVTEPLGRPGPTFVAAARPPDAHAIDANFEDKVHLIGYRFDPIAPKPGDTVRITLMWRCDAALREQGWQLFTHVADDATGKMENISFSGLPGSLRELEGGRQRWGPDRWQAGKIYIDRLVYVVPLDAVGSNGALTLYVGVWREDIRLRVVAGANDGDSRAIVRMPLAP